jgi:hypothetical protein
LANVRIHHYKVFVILLGFIAIYFQGQAYEKPKVYTSLKLALKEPDKVLVLDLRGQRLDSLPREIGQLKNLEVLLLDSKLRTLWLYPKAWKYKFGFKRLPAGGYAHLQGRGAGKFFKFNNLKELPNEICDLKKLKLIDIYYNPLDAKKWEEKLKFCTPEILVMSSYFDDYTTFEKEFDAAKIILTKYDIEN